MEYWVTAKISLNSLDRIFRILYFLKPGLNRGTRSHKSKLDLCCTRQLAQSPRCPITFILNRSIYGCHTQPGEERIPIRVVDNIGIEAATFPLIRLFGRLEIAQRWACSNLRWAMLFLGGMTIEENKEWTVGDWPFSIGTLVCWGGIGITKKSQKYW